MKPASTALRQLETIDVITTERSFTDDERAQFLQEVLALELCTAHSLISQTKPQNIFAVETCIEAAVASSPDLDSSELRRMMWEASAKVFQDFSGKKLKALCKQLHAKAAPKMAEYVWIHTSRVLLLILYSVHAARQARSRPTLLRATSPSARCSCRTFFQKSDRVDSV